MFHMFVCFAIAHSKKHGREVKDVPFFKYLFVQPRRFIFLS